METLMVFRELAKTVTSVAVALSLVLIPVCSFAATEPPPEPTVVSTEQCSGLWMVPLVWTPSDGNAHDLLAVFDTGANSAFIDPDALERISGRRIPEGKRVELDDMQVAGKDFNAFSVRVKDLDHLSRVLGRELDVFLPFQTFRSYLLVLDYPAGEMRIERGELPKPDNREIFSAKGPDRRPWLEMRLGPRRSRKLLIDSGSTNSFAVRDFDGLDWVSPPVPLRVYQGMYDVELARVGRMDGSLRMGPLEFEDPIISLTEDTELIGAKVLRHFVVTFDQKKRRVRFVTSEERAVQLESERGTGAILSMNESGYRVAHVLPGSPAEAAGLHAEDLITHVDGRSVFDVGCRPISRETPSHVVFSIQRGAERFEIGLDTAILVP